MTEERGNLQKHCCPNAVPMQLNASLSQNEQNFPFYHSDTQKTMYSNTSLNGITLKSDDRLHLNLHCWVTLKADTLNVRMSPEKCGASITGALIHALQDAESQPYIRGPFLLVLCMPLIFTLTRFFSLFTALWPSCRTFIFLLTSELPSQCLGYTGGFCWSLSPLISATPFLSSLASRPPCRLPSWLFLFPSLVPLITLLPSVGIGHARILPSPSHDLTPLPPPTPAVQHEEHGEGAAVPSM